MLYTIGMIESGLEARYQFTSKESAFKKGYARGLWQFEANGGVIGVIKHVSTKEKILPLLKKYVGADTSLSTNQYAVWATLQCEPKFACMFARLFMTWDSNPVPQPILDNEDAAWAYYILHWGPGKPDRKKWTNSWMKAVRNK